MSGFREGVGDVARSALSGFGNAYEAVLTGRPLPSTEMTGDMVQTTEPAADIPQSYEAALREHQAMEAADHQAGQEAISQDTGPDVDTSAQEINQPQPDIGV